MSKLRLNIISETTFTVRGHGVHTAFVEMAAGLRQRDDTDVKINSFREADIIHVHTIGPYSLAALLFGRGNKVVSVHVIPDSFIGSLAGAKYWYKAAGWYLHFFYSRADLLIAVSDEVKLALTQKLSITKPVRVIFNTVDSQEYHTEPQDKVVARQQLKISGDAFTIVGVGQVQPRKRFDTFVRLARELPEYRFFWVGGIPFKALGADHEAMEAMVTGAPSNLTVTGVIELAEVKKYYQAANAFILPSNQENHPLAVIEAAAAGLPVIIRDIPEYDSSFGDDLIRSGENGFARELMKLQREPEYYKQAVAGSRRVAERFNNARGAEQFMEAYRALIADTL